MMMMIYGVLRVFLVLIMTRLVIIYVVSWTIFVPVWMLYNPIEGYVRGMMHGNYSIVVGMMVLVVPEVLCALVPVLVVVVLRGWLRRGDYPC
jgi:hypothetical protein